MGRIDKRMERGRSVGDSSDMVDEGRDTVDMKGGNGGITVWLPSLR